MRFRLKNYLVIKKTHMVISCTFFPRKVKKCNQIILKAKDRCYLYPFTCFTGFRLSLVLSFKLI